MIGYKIRAIMKKENIGLKDLMKSINKGKVIADTPQNILGKLSRETIRFMDVEEILNAIGYHIEIKKSNEGASNKMKTTIKDILVPFAAIQELIKKKTGIHTQIIMTSNKDAGDGLFFFIDKDIKVSKVDYANTEDGDLELFAFDENGVEIPFEKVITLLWEFEVVNPSTNPSLSLEGARNGILVINQDCITDEEAEYLHTLSCVE